MPLCLRRVDWPVAQLLPCLRDCRPWVDEPLLASLDSGSEVEVLRAIELLKGLRIAPGLPFQQSLLAQAAPALLAESLLLADQPALLVQVRSFLSHSDNRVRAAAAEALARIGDASDLNTLTAMLGDLSWRVRNAAARAILVLPGGGEQSLHEAGERCGDRYGRNMAQHVLAERAMAVADY